MRLFTCKHETKYDWKVTALSEVLVLEYSHLPKLLDSGIHPFFWSHS